METAKIENEASKSELIKALEQLGAYEVLVTTAKWMHDEWPKGANAQLRPDLVDKMKRSATEVLCVANRMLF